MDGEKAALQAEIEDLRREVQRLRIQAGTQRKRGLFRRSGVAIEPPSPRAVQQRRLAVSAAVGVPSRERRSTRFDDRWLDDDEEQDRAFEAFYGAYDEAHAKIRKFLLD